MEIPKTVSGRRVTTRGVHLQPSGQHAGEKGWMARADYWIGLLVSMHMSWVTAISDSDALYTSGAARALLEAGVIPIVRFAYTFPGAWTHGAAVEQLVNLYARYNAPLVVQFANEPFDEREWRKGEVPNYESAWAIIAARWAEAARAITERGAIAGFPDGPGYSENPFERIRATEGLWHEGQAVYLGHFYGKGRPLDYPYDEVSQRGVTLTMEEYRRLLDDYADDPQWNEGPSVLAQINAQRRAWARPGQTALDDDTCFRGYEKVLAWSRASFGFEVPLAMTEGGWTPRDRPGSGNAVDIRWPMTTPKMVAAKTLAMYEADTPMFALTPWILASDDMGASGWPDDCWVGYAFSDRYGREKPVVRALQANAPEAAPGLSAPARIAAARDRLAGLDLAGARQALEKVLGRG